jgi:hypothetical protein
MPKSKEEYENMSTYSALLDLVKHLRKRQNHSLSAPRFKCYEEAIALVMSVFDKSQWEEIDHLDDSRFDSESQESDIPEDCNCTYGCHICAKSSKLSVDTNENVDDVCCLRCSHFDVPTTTCCHESFSVPVPVSDELQMHRCSCFEEAFP